MFSVGDITQLIGEDEGVANMRVNVAVRMSINPVVYVRVGNVVAQTQVQCIVLLAHDG